MTTNFPTSLDSYTPKAGGETISENHINNVEDAIEALQTKVGINSSGVDTSVDYKVNNFFVENTRAIWFYENTCPTGWTYQSGITDQVLAVKGGADAYDANGGTEENGSWTQLDHLHQWYEPDWGGRSRSYDSVGDAQNMNAAQDYNFGITAQYGVSGDEGLYDNWYTSLAAPANTWRPDAALGVIGKYTGGA